MSASAENSDKVRMLPGGVGLWIFILSDLLLFGLFFALFARDFSVNAVIFSFSKSALNSTLGLLNTVLLLTGSWAVVMATRVVMEARRSALYLMGAAGCGILFLCVKSVEYAHLIEDGHTFTDNPFYSWYFILTGYHALHVMAGVLILSIVAMFYAKNNVLADDLIEACACYWHLVDLLWIGIFSLVYLI